MPSPFDAASHSAPVSATLSPTAIGTLSVDAKKRKKRSEDSTALFSSQKTSAAAWFGSKFDKYYRPCAGPSHARHHHYCHHHGHYGRPGSNKTSVSGSSMLLHCRSWGLSSGHTPGPLCTPLTPSPSTGACHITPSTTPLCSHNTGGG
uniref:Uncharacterized protein n=1 Tax=Knipowitschia caucasica TaxID=637954 RepID=A0AAV2LXI4_KNICA